MNLSALFAAIPVPADAKERGWNMIASAHRGAFAARPQPGDGHITGSTGALLLSGPAVQTPCPGRPTPAGAPEGAV